jgi:hypothetical protein
MTVTRTPATFAVNVKDFGVRGDSVTDDTARIQAWVTHITTNHLPGVMPAGTYRITSRIEFPRTYGWSIRGAGPQQTIIRQDTDNAAVLWMGSDTASTGHSWSIANLQLTYNATQSTANTSAICLAFNQEFWGGRIDNVWFQRGWYGIALAQSIPAPWGCIWDNLTFGTELSGGAIDNNTNNAASTPNNHWGKFYVRGDAMAGPVFLVRGYNWTWDSVEFNVMALGPKLIFLAGGQPEVRIGAVKLEGATYASGTTNYLIEVGTGGSLNLDQLTVSGTPLTIGAGVVVYAVQAGTGGGQGNVRVGMVRLGGSAITGTIYAFGGAVSGGIVLGDFVSQHANAKLVNNGSTVTANNLVVDSYTNHRMSDDKGDANYTVALKDPNIIQLETAFTAQRTVSLPSDGNFLHNGQYYETVVNTGVVNGANTLLIKCGATTLHTETTDKKVIRFTWRRNVTVANGWKMTKYETLP